MFLVSQLFPLSTLARALVGSCILVVLAVPILYIHFFRPMTREIHERKASEEALRRSEQCFRNLADYALDWEYWLGPSGDLIYNSPSCEHVSGYKAEEFYENPSLFINIIHPEDRERWERYRHNVFKEGELEELEFRIVTKKGEERWIGHTCQDVKEEHGNSLGLRICNRDITSKKIRESQLTRLSAAVDQSPNMVVITDSSGSIEYINKASEEVTGLLPGWLHKRRVCMLGTADALGGRYRELLDTIKQGKTWTGEYKNKRKDDTFFWERLKITPIFDEDGKIVSYLSISEDITEQKALQSQVLGFQKLEAVGQLAGGVAHDFNNVLTAINGFAELALMQVDKGDPIRHALLQIKRSGEQASHLTRQLLTFSRKQVIEPTVVDINSLVSDMHKMLERLIGEDIDFRTILGEGVDEIKADPGQLNQVLINLVVNARDAIEERTHIASEKRITIETSNVFLDKHYVNTHVGSKVGRHVLISVTDTGIGMDKETLPRIFEPFFTTKAQGKGTGMGLASVFGIIKQNEGNIYVYSEPGKGSTFRIYWPSMEEPYQDGRQEISEEIARDALVGGHETILVAEDAPRLRELACSTLQPLGYKVHQAENGKQALEMVTERALKVDLLFTDVVMPVIGGRVLAERLKSLMPNLKILYTTGYTDKHIVHNGILEPGVELLEKPYTPFTLSQKIREVLNQRV